MKYLVVGLGSMGKRRVRNLQSIGIIDIAGFDTRLDRRNEAHEKYDIPVFESLKEAMHSFKPQVFVISTPPDLHMYYAYFAFEQGISCFIEASVVHADEIKQLNDVIRGSKIIMAPSCTMRYFPGPKKIKELIQANAIGEVFNFNYHTGQYLPDWHPWEKIEDFYVSNHETGAAREIVPFELTWLNDIFGHPLALACVKAKLSNINADIDDIYHFLLHYNSSIMASITVEVISRPKAVRELRVIGSEGQIVFSADSNRVSFINTAMADWIHFKFDAGTVESHYINPEEPYIAEIKDFVFAVESNDQSLFPNSLEDDYRVLQVLYSLEDLAGAVL